MSAAFASDLDAMVSKADLWVHGHIHDSMDYRLGKARVVCNPLGYPLSDSDGAWFRENPMYDPNLVIEVGEHESGQQVLLDAAGRRDELARQWLSASDVSHQLGAAPSSTSAASQLRRGGELRAVYKTHPRPCYRYPTWQFSPGG